MQNTLGVRLDSASSRSADRGISGSSKGESPKRNTDEGDGEAGCDEDRGAAPHGPRSMDLTDPATRNYCPALAK